MNDKPTPASPTPSGTEYDRRADFLIAMYGQLMNDINRHIVVIWQMVGVLGAAVASLVLAESQGIPTAYAASLVIVVTMWVVDHLHDSNFWYNRNLVMITNIERVFLNSDDVDLIHPYFAEHRKSGSFLTHLKIQRFYAILITVLIMVYFIIYSVVPSWELGGKPDLVKWVPFLLFYGLIIRDQNRVEHYSKKYKDYLKISPGIDVKRSVDYGTSHGKR